MKLDINININHYHQPDSDTLKALEMVSSVVTKILKNTKTVMAKQDQFDAVLARIDAATSAIAAELEDLKGQITGAGLSAEAEDSILATLDSAVTKLEAFGKPGEEPQPETPTEPTPGEEPAPV